MTSSPSVQPDAGIALATRLRGATAVLHQEVERKLGLPESITNLTTYTECLARFYRLYRPLEALLSRFSGWKDIGIDLGARAKAGRLALDLAALGVFIGQLEEAPPACLPRLPTFSHALGALYVMEGSTLGAQFILRRLSQMLGEEILGADTFFYGSGAQTGELWQQFRISLDRYGLAHPESTVDVIDGARATFGAIGIWMQP